MNIFRLVGDSSHSLAIIILLHKILTTKSCAGLSGKSQILYTMVFWARYLDLFFYFISPYNTTLKIFYIITACLILYLRYVKYKETCDHESDSFRIEFLIIPTFVLALIANHSFTVIEVLWTFSIYLEAVAIVPQLVLILKTNKAETITLYYLLALGAYRTFYILNWIYRYNVEGFFDPISISGGIVQTLTYGLFFYLYVTRAMESPYDVGIV